MPATVVFFSFLFMFAVFYCEVLYVNRLLIDNPSYVPVCHPELFRIAAGLSLKVIPVHLALLLKIICCILSVLDNIVLCCVNLGLSQTLITS